MQVADYVKTVPDEHLRTAISGFLMREGWNHLAEDVEKIIDRSGMEWGGCEECGETILKNVDHALCTDCDNGLV